jgi:hypothetical protein
MSQNCIVSVKFLKDVRDFDRNATNSVKKKLFSHFVLLAHVDPNNIIFMPPAVIDGFA